MEKVSIGHGIYEERPFSLFDSSSTYCWVDLWSWNKRNAVQYLSPHKILLFLSIPPHCAALNVSSITSGVVLAPLAQEAVDLRLFSNLQQKTRLPLRKSIVRNHHKTFRPNHKRVKTNRPYAIKIVKMSHKVSKSRKTLASTWKQCKNFFAILLFTCA